MPAITVLMPVFNAERFLEEAIRSILNQTFIEFEFLIIDDCSTDKSAFIIQSFKDARIRYIKNERNLGISPTLNKGIELARGKWIARMDADDISYPDRLQKQYDFIEKNNDGALFSCDVRVISEAGEFLRQDQFNPDFYYYNLTFICWIYHPTIIFSKRAVLEVGMYTVPYAEDFELFWQLTRNHKHYHLAEVLLDYRVTNQSLHQVLKKNEYLASHKDQVLRNIRYFTSSSFIIPETYIDCFQHDFEPLLKEGNVALIVDCIKQLEFISEKIAQTQNINANKENILMASIHKRNFIVYTFMKRLPLHKSILLVIKLGEAKKFIYKRLKNLLQR